MTGLRARMTERAQYGSAAEFAYATLRGEIMGGHLQPGHRMREQELSERLQVSRTPVREALSRLQADGLLVMQPRSGLAVAELDDAGVIELYETREALEGTAAQLAARYANPRDIAAMRSILAAEELAPDDPVQQQRHNRIFHAAVLAASHNRFLVKSLQVLHDALTLLGPTTLARPDRRAQAQAEHRQVLDAIEKRDSAAAEAVMRAHVRHGAEVRQHMRGAAAQD
ncbi:GntR family transcriptional regulator [Falsiroseomonas sp. CW058]|uniref:GntR family transcriptional regulator n=1 Tax=Falsiroseomonas sp. CW058 TaxID=3388664 RepID=UPI003D31B1F0